MFNVARPEIFRPPDFAATRRPRTAPGNRTGVARPCGGESPAQTHCETAVGDHIGQPGQLGYVLAPVVRVAGEDKPLPEMSASTGFAEFMGKGLYH